MGRLPGAASAAAKAQRGLRFYIALTAAIVLGAIAITIAFSFLSERVRDFILSARYPTAESAAARPAPASVNPDDRPPLRVAVAPIISLENSLDRYDGFVRLLGDRMGMHGTLVLRRTYAEVNDLLRTRRCEAGFICTYSFVKGEREFGLRALAVPVVGGETEYRSYVIVQKGDPARNLLDLAGHRFASADVGSTSGWIYPAVWLLDRGRDPAAFFREHVVTGSHDLSVLAVAHGFVDAAAVDNIVYEGMPDEAKAATRVIQRSPPFSMPPVCVHPSLEPAVRERLRAVLLTMHETPEGRAVLGPLKIDRFVAPPAGAYRNVREMAARWEASR